MAEDERTTPSDDVASRASDAAAEPTSGGLVDALRGALGLCTRFPVGTDPVSWETFRRTPAAFVPVGYLVGALAAVPFFLPLPAATLALLFPVILVALTGINHADGVADVADAAVVHGERADPVGDRRRVLKDSDLGVGGTLALALLVAGLVTAGATLAGLPPTAAVAIVVAAEVSAKFGMALLACLGTAPAGGLGAQLTRVSADRDLLGPALLAVPAAFLGAPSPAAAVGLLAGVLATVALHRWADRHLGGVNGDVFGAANELARVVALHAGVIAWTLF